MEKLNRVQAQSLFDENAILFGNADGIPEETVISLFGEAALAHVKRIEGAAGTLFNGYGNGNFTAFYLTLKGFLLAATYCNVCQLEAERKDG